MSPHSDHDPPSGERLVRVETKLDILINTVDRIPATHEMLNKRITALEQWRSMALGAMMIVNIVFIILLDKIKGLL
jgi:hypothetical protein